MILKRSLIALLCLPFTLAIADDTELFVSDIADENDLKPQVLIVFDTSGSMDTAEENTPEAYDPSIDYITNSSDRDKIYWSTNDEIPSTDSNDFFDSANNNCFSSSDSLNNNGLYNGSIRHAVEYSRQRQSYWYWSKLDSYEDSTDIFDCEGDETATIVGTRSYPLNNSLSAYSIVQTDVFGSGDSATLYSANYIYWKETSGSTTRSRIDIAKEAITQLIGSTPSVDFGLAVFNYNGRSNNGTESKNGGRIVDKVQTRESTEDLINAINNFDAYGGTPLCETMYEAYRYFGGHSVEFGNDDPDKTPARDESAESSGVYISPFKTCQERAYIILMTDGQPQYDTSANSSIKNLTGENNAIEDSYMPVLSKWMNENDIDGDDSNGDQFITTYTIGFGQDAVDDAGQLLSKTATLGGGEYFPATSAEALQTAFTSTILEILNTSSSLSSPSLATNNFDRTESLDSIYFSMFLPDTKTVWKGNIKKLSINDDGVIVDRNGASAIDDDGNIKATASTYWGGNADGNTVAEGGVSQMLGNMTEARKILSNIEPSDTSIVNDVAEIVDGIGILDSSSTLDLVLPTETELGLLEPNKENLKAFYGVTTDIALANILEVETTATTAGDDVTDSLNWLKGLDVDDEDADDSTADNRSDIFGDPLHSKPLTVIYTDDNDNQVVRFLVGTNAGFLHMFTDHGDTVTENWAFIPQQLLNSALNVREGTESDEHHYGMDLTPISITISENDTDQIIAIVGMRRGGNSYFALDITDADNPTLLWKVDGGTADFAQLGQSWSKPSVGTFRYMSGNTEITAKGIVFGGGYDTNKDTCQPSNEINCNDNTGRAVYIVNAITGEKIWSVSGENCDEDDLHCLNDGIPSAVTLLDSDSDGYTDRIYVGDTGANLWRMDIVGTDTSKWSHIKLAELGGDTAATNRRFFTAPVIVNTFENTVVELDDDSYSYKKTAYDGILLGSGDRAHPASDVTTEDIFYNIHDYNINPTLFGDGGSTKPTPLVEGSLFDITNTNLSSDSTETQLLSIFADMSLTSGWKYQLTGIGEKSLGQGAVLDGTVYFTSFVPNSIDNLTCGIGDIGTGWLYAVDLHTGTNKFTNSNINDDDETNDNEVIEKINIGSLVPDSLVIYSSIDDDGISSLKLLGVGQGDALTIDVDGNSEEVNAGTLDTGADMLPRRIYSFFDEK